jgi:hypothetical protein
MTLDLRPVSLREARAFVAAHHRHNVAPRGWKFGVGLWQDDALVSVGIAGRPVARALDDGLTVEITRVCTLGQRNAASRLYGALCRAAAALGYRRAVTYNLASESGVSLRAAGFVLVEILGHRETWATPSRPRQDVTLFGDAVLPTEARNRWERRLAVAS